MADVNDYGIKVSRQGYPVQTAADHQLIFSSSFKLPLILFSGFSSFDGNTAPQTLFTHNLGYVPLFLLYAFTSSSVPNRVHLDNAQDTGTGYMYVDTTKLVYQTGLGGITVDYAYFIFAWDLTVSYTAPNVNLTSATQGAINNDYGFKVSKDGADVSSAGLINLNVFSGSSLAGQPVRNHVIHMVVPTTVNDGATLTIAHNLGYKPMFVVFIKNGTVYNIISVSYQVSAGPTVTEKWRGWADNTNINIRNSSGVNKTITVLIFKDPLLT